ncbi:MAG: hypothetical protein KN64_14070 [Sulfurovum sp. AS07-7]|nr:MAG: hypothetical protein KN64_14070 [Sulfurovum sp. AS07-7]
MNRVIPIIFLFFSFVYADLELQDWSGAKVDEVYPRKYDIYKMACEKDNEEACFILGLSDLQSYTQNNNDKIYLKSAIGYFEKACAKNHEKSCLALGLLYISASFEGRDEKASMYYLDRSCSLGNVLSCINIAKYYEDEKHLDIQKTIKYLESACDKKNDEACAYAAILYHDGKKVEADHQKAISFYKRSIAINKAAPSNYLNIFEINLVEDKAFDKTIEKSFLKLFAKDKQSMMFYDMLKIFQNAKLNKRYNLTLWNKKYKNMNLNEWDFGTIEKWIADTKDSKIKDELSKIVDGFKNLNKENR